LRDKDFAAGRIDTGYLERLLAEEVTHKISNETARVAAIGAALFAMNNGSNAGASNGVANGKRNGGIAVESAAWKSVARKEGLRE
jgi:hypothetical protein